MQIHVCGFNSACVCVSSQDYRSLIENLPEDDRPAFFGLPANIERSSQRIISSQVQPHTRICTYTPTWLFPQTLPHHHHNLHLLLMLAEFRTHIFIRSNQSTQDINCLIYILFKTIKSRFFVLFNPWNFNFCYAICCLDLIDNTHSIVDIP